MAELEGQLTLFDLDAFTDRSKDHREGTSMNSTPGGTKSSRRPVIDDVCGCTGHGR